MVTRSCLFFLVLVAVWCTTKAANIPQLPSRIGDEEVEEVMSEMMNIDDIDDDDDDGVGAVVRARVLEGVPPPLCSRSCDAPPLGPVCAFDAAGTARTFASLCELEAVSCHESIYLAVTSFGEC